MVRVSMRAAGLPEVPEQTALVAGAAFPKRVPAMRVREKLAEVFSDEPFVAAFGVRGAPGLSPGMLALVTVLHCRCFLGVSHIPQLPLIRRGVSS